MRDYRQCTECGTTDTKRVYIDSHTDQIEEVRICEACDTQYTNLWTLEVQRTWTEPR